MAEETELTAHQRVLMELWTEFDRICRKHRIHYMLFAGSALGAVRHRGIIPWDDDLDVVMLREEYERFLQLAPGELDPQKYVLQKEFSEHWPMFFSKLRKNNTACMERYVPRDPQIHQGIYMDIFPCDNLHDNPFARKMQFVASKIVIAKSLNLRGYASDKMTKKLFMALCSLIPDEGLAKLVRYQKGKNNEYVHTFFGGGSIYRKNIFPRTWFTNTVRIPFCGEKAPVSICSDRLLRTLYGDYLTPLPEPERRCKIHADIVDPEHSYELYLEQQRKQRFRDYARSIR